MRLKWKLVSVYLEIVTLLGDISYVKSYSGLFRYSVRVGVRQVHGLRQTYHSLRNYFECT
jgi:hypothetical protein